MADQFYLIGSKTEKAGSKILTLKLDLWKPIRVTYKIVLKTSSPMSKECLEEIKTFQHHYVGFRGPICQQRRCGVWTSDSSYNIDHNFFVFRHN